MVPLLVSVPTVPEFWTKIPVPAPLPYPPFSPLITPALDKVVIAPASNTPTPPFPPRIVAFAWLISDPIVAP
jgi:hypothetical protein